MGGRPTSSTGESRPRVYDCFYDSFKPAHIRFSQPAGIQLNQPVSETVSSPLCKGFNAINCLHAEDPGSEGPGFSSWAASFRAPDATPIQQQCNSMVHL